MPSIAIQEAFVAISAADAAGNLTVTSTDYLYPGAMAWVQKDDGSAPSARVKILAVTGETIVRVRRFINDNENSPPNYGASSMTSFNGGSHICQECQTAPVDPSFRRRILP